MGIVSRPWKVVVVVTIEAGEMTAVDGVIPGAIGAVTPDFRADRLGVLTRGSGTVGVVGKVLIGRDTRAMVYRGVAAIVGMALVGPMTGIDLVVIAMTGKITDGTLDEMTDVG